MYIISKEINQMPSRPLTTPSGRPNTFGMRVRERIDVSRTINKLQTHLFSDREEDKLTMADIQVAKLLLSKSVPDLKAIEVQDSGDVNAKTITNRDLFNVIEGSARRIEEK
jgi:hypothetical protein